MTRDEVVGRDWSAAPPGDEIEEALDILMDGKASRIGADGRRLRSRRYSRSLDAIERILCFFPGARFTLEFDTTDGAPYGLGSIGRWHAHIDGPDDEGWEQDGYSDESPPLAICRALLHFGRE